VCGHRGTDIRPDWQSHQGLKFALSVAVALPAQHPMALIKIWRTGKKPEKGNLKRAAIGNRSPRFSG
jgi:hypothetical protein